MILFSRLRIRGTLTGKLAPLSFGVYLFQLNKIIWDELLTNRMAFAAEKPFFISVGITVACAAALFCTGLFVEFLRSRLAVLLRIPALSRKITDAAEAVLRRSVRLLK